jgi:hypothetical protein
LEKRNGSQQIVLPQKKKQRMKAIFGWKEEPSCENDAHKDWFN